jgi:hypothetical protein
VVQLVGPGEHRQRAGPALRSEESGAAARVVPCRDRHVGDLLEGVLAGLAGLPLDQVEELFLPVEHEIVVAQQNLGPLARAGGRPGALRAAGALECGRDVVGRRHGHRGERLSGERRDRVGGLAGGAHDEADELLDDLLVQRCPGGCGHACSWVGLVVTRR